MRPRLGILAGRGPFPWLVARAARERGIPVVVLGLAGLATPPAGEEIPWVAVEIQGLEALLRACYQQGIQQVALAGGVPKGILFDPRVWGDARVQAVLSRVAERGDDALLRALARELERMGIQVVEATRFLDHLRAPEGVLTQREPTPEEWADIRFGLEVARAIGALDIGQCVVVRSRAVLAVEAAEGTDETIRRGGRLAREGAVVVKVAKPGQDTRFDLPVVGPDTLEAMAEVRARVLAMEAGMTLLLDQDRLVAEADRLGIALVGVGHGGV